MDWYTWHRRYDESSDMRERLRAVQSHITAAVDGSQSGGIEILSICAGDGRDVIAALAARLDRSDIMATLVEVDPRLVASGEAAIDDTGLTNRCRFIQADATDAATYEGRVPVDIVVAAGILGNLVPSEVERFVASLRWFCRTNAFVIWTRNLDVSDGRRQVPVIQRTFHRHGFRQNGLIRTAGHVVGLHRYAGPPQPKPQDAAFFHFAGFEAIDKELAGRRIHIPLGATLHRWLRVFRDRTGSPWA